MTPSSPPSGSPCMAVASPPMPRSRDRLRHPIHPCRKVSSWLQHLARSTPCCRPSTPSSSKFSPHRAPAGCGGRVASANHENAGGFPSSSLSTAASTTMARSTHQDTLGMTAAPNGRRSSHYGPKHRRSRRHRLVQASHRRLAQGRSLRRRHLHLRELRDRRRHHGTTAPWSRPTSRRGASLDWSRPSAAASAAPA
jgi:hypothetical protein